MLESINDDWFGKTLLLNCPPNAIKKSELKALGIGIKKIIEFNKSSKERDKNLFWFGIFRVCRLLPQFNDWDNYQIFVFNDEAADGFISTKYGQYSPTFITTSKSLVTKIKEPYLLAVECLKAQDVISKLAVEIQNFSDYNNINVPKKVQTQLLKLKALEKFGDEDTTKAIKTIEKLFLNGWK